MRLLDVDTGKPLRDVCVYLTPLEARQMLGYLKGLVNGRVEHHAHVNDDSYEREVTIAVYTERNLDQFDERSRKLILEGY